MIHVIRTPGSAFAAGSAASVPAAGVTAVAALLTLAACGAGDGGGPRGWEGEVRDSAGMLLVQNPAAGVWRPDEGWRLVADLSIGQLEGPAEYTFFRASDVAVDDDGRIYVLDQGDKVVKVYDREGRFRRFVGREGEGPGEFREPSRMMLDGDTLVVFDWRSNKLVFFATADGEFRREVRFEHGFAFPERLRPGPRGTFVLGMTIGFSLPRQPEAEGMAMLLGIQAYRDRWLGREDLSAGVRRRYEAILRDVSYPSSWPAFDAIRLDPAGRLWVRRPPATDAATAYWDVFDEEGRYLGEVLAPAGLRAAVVTEHAVHGIETDDFDVQYLRRYRIERPATLAASPLSNDRNALR